ncbi:MAG: SDR family NAD(P)-dependent oxidoreductase [Deinococcus sp.]|nr:SDR family NAD(P)-dependent oxidoreductase [Deinococcus sp.]
MDLKMESKIVVISNAGSGIGRTIARTFGQIGSYVVVLDPDPEDSTRVATEIEEAGGRAIPIKIDPTTGLEVAAGFERIAELFGQVDVLVTTPAVIGSATLLSLSEFEWSEVINADLKAAFLVSQAATRLMAARDVPGQIILVAPAQPEGVMRPHIAAAQAGIIGLARSMAEELKPRIQVNAVVPPPPDQTRDIELGEVVVGPVIFFASRLSRGITGQHLQAGSRV